LQEIEGEERRNVTQVKESAWEASKVLHAAYTLNVYRCPAKSASRSLLEMLQ
jgi:hypothetical protein